MGRLFKHVKTELTYWGRQWADDTGYVVPRLKGLVDLILVLPFAFVMGVLTLLLGIPEDFAIPAGLVLAGGAIIVSHRWWWSRLVMIAWLVVMFGVILADSVVAEMWPGDLYERLIRPLTIAVALLVGAYVVNRRWGPQLRRFFRDPSPAEVAAGSDRTTSVSRQG